MAPSLSFAWRRTWNLLLVSVVVAVLSFAANLYLAQKDPIADFYLPIPRFWELMLGAILAYIAIHKPCNLPNIHANFLSLLGVTMIGVGLAAITEDKSFPGLWALLPTLGTFLIIAAGPSAWLNKCILSNPLLVGLGLISYPLYLVHWPIISFFHILHPGPVSPSLNILIIAIALFLAIAIFWVIEHPVRTGKFARPKVLAALLSITAMMATATFAAQGFPDRINPPAGSTHSDFSMPLSTNGWCFYSVDSEPSIPILPPGRRCRLGRQDSVHGGLLIGDSFAGQYEPFWNQIARDNGLFIDSITTNWCYPSLSNNFSGRQPAGLTSNV